MLAKWEKREVYRWHFVNRLANHFSHLTFRRSHRVISIFTKRQRGALFVHLSSFSQNQRWMKSAILWDVYSDSFAISWNSSRNSARTCRNVKNDRCITSFRDQNDTRYKADSHSVRILRKFLVEIRGKFLPHHRENIEKILLSQLYAYFFRILQYFANDFTKHMAKSEKFSIQLSHFHPISYFLNFVK